jgi:predicted pyridoxine 5'-phosphate oxidase superfamily flavin-nucleotide-binding protein
MVPVALVDQRVRAVHIRPMGERYHDGSRKLQDHFDTRRLADRLHERTIRDVIRPQDREFIERMDMFFLGTSDDAGQPQCSYKGGDPGFITVIDENTLAFPNYDGNGMFLSLGNVLVNPKIGMLLIDFTAERPERMRIEGFATIAENDDLEWEYPGAQFIVRVHVLRLFPNCPRYIHRMALVERSPYVPRAGVPTPVPDWKRNLAADTLPAGDPAAQPPG